MAVNRLFQETETDVAEYKSLCGSPSWLVPLASVVLKCKLQFITSMFGQMQRHQINEQLDHFFLSRQSLCIGDILVQLWGLTFSHAQAPGGVQSLFLPIFYSWGNLHKRTGNVVGLNFQEMRGCGRLQLLSETNHAIKEEWADRIDADHFQCGGVSPQTAKDNSGQLQSKSRVHGAVRWPSGTLLDSNVLKY